MGTLKENEIINNSASIIFLQLCKINSGNGIDLDARKIPLAVSFAKLINDEVIKQMGCDQ